MTAHGLRRDPADLCRMTLKTTWAIMFLLVSLKLFLLKNIQGGEGEIEMSLLLSAIVPFCC